MTGTQAKVPCNTPATLSCYYVLFNALTFTSIDSSFFFFSLFVWLHWVLVASYGILAEACRIYFPDQGSNLDPCIWEQRVLVTGSPGKSLVPLLLSNI